MYTFKKLPACSYVVKTLQEGYVNTNCRRLTHTRATGAGECCFLTLPYEKLTQKHLSHRSYQDGDCSILCAYIRR